ncbi:MAG: MurR/RpiR family transcriptional regulator [Lachnospiraceae bacterium]
MEGNLDLLARIKSGMAGFSKGQRAIARYIISNYDKASYMTAQVLGENAGVSESTVVRFALGLGFSGYPQFQKAMADYVSSRLQKLRRLEISAEQMNPDEIADFVMANDMENIKNSWKNLDINALNGALDSIIQGRRIYVMGIRECAAMAMHFARNLRIVHSDVRLICACESTDILEQLLSIGAQDVLIGISFPRYSMRTIKAMEYANDRNARVIALTDDRHSPMCLYSSCNLLASSNMSSVVDSFAAPISLINVVTVGLIMRQKMEVLSDMQHLEEVWKEYGENERDEIDLFDSDRMKDFK